MRSANMCKGSPTANYSINWSQLQRTHQGCAFEKVTISGGQFITAGASFLVGKKDNPVFIRARDDYLSQLRWISKKFVILYDVADRRAWMVDGVSALLHLVRASLRNNQDDDFADLFLSDAKDLVEAGSDRIGKAAAISVLTNNQNWSIRLHQRPEDSFEEETTKQGEDTERITKKTTTFYCFKDRVDHIYHVLEQMIAYQSQVDSQDGIGFKVKASSRRQLEGFDFMDVASDEDPLWPRVVTLASTGAGWVDFARAMHAVTLFGRGFGDLLSPSSEIQICAHWKTVPRGLDYLTVCVSDLKEILKKRGDTLSNPWRLIDDIRWHNPETIFGPCKRSKKPKISKCCDRVQVLLPSSFPSLWARQYRSPSRLEDSGAVIFGHNRKLPLRWGDSGDPEEEAGPSASNDTPAASPPDSGIGSSVGSTPSNGGRSQPPTASPTTDEVSRRKTGGWLFRSGRRKKQKTEASASKDGTIRSFDES